MAGLPSLTGVAQAPLVSALGEALQTVRTPGRGGSGSVQFAGTSLTRTPLRSATFTPGGVIGGGDDNINYRYVRPGAPTAGADGRSWTTAWPSISSVNSSNVSPGMTVFLAGGNNYGAWRPAINGTSTSRITIKAATNASHGTNTGWSSAYAVDTGNNPVIFDAGGSPAPSETRALNLDGSNWVTVDGQYRSGLESGYGIVARNAYSAIHADNGSGSNGITLRFIEASVMPNPLVDRREDGIQGKGNDLLVEYCYIHDNDSGITHGDGIQWFGGERITLRYNIWKNGGQAIYIGDAALNTYAYNVDIYYNLIYNRGGGHYNGILFAGHSSHATYNGGSPAYFNVYNNTFDLECRLNDQGQTTGFDSILNAVPGEAIIRFRNNAFRAVDTNTMSWRTQNSNNAYDNSGTGSSCFNIPTGEAGRVVAANLGFVVEPPNAAADFRLASTSVLRGAGMSLGFTQDILGNPVPATPDIGCFQYTP